MTTTPGPIFTPARIVTPEEAAIDQRELLQMRMLLALARMAGTSLHLVQFDDGVAAMIVGDPRDTEAWQALLTKTHDAAIAGHVGPVDFDAEDA